MSDSLDGLRRLRTANMVPPSSDKPDAAWTSELLFERIQEKATGVQTLERPITLPSSARSRRRLGLRIAVAAAAVVLIPVLLIGLALSGSREDESVATTPQPSPTTVPTVVVPTETDVSNVPFYARISSDEIFHNEDWALIVFYRPPSCIPPNANFLAALDAETVSECGPPTVDGVATWENGPATDAAPLETEFAGRGDVPVWLVPWPMLEGSIADGVLTRRDLLSMQTRLEGTMSSYLERIDPIGRELAGEGQLADGRPVSFLATEDGAGLELVVSPLSGFEAATAGDLVGAWDDGETRLEFAADGTFTMIESERRENFGIAPPDSGDLVQEGTYTVASGVIALTATDAGLCPFPDQTGTYFAQLGVDGVLVLDTITDICGNEPPQQLVEPLTRVE